MGLYTIACPECGKDHQWFSGTTDQRCGDCSPEKELGEVPRMECRVPNLVCVTTQTYYDSVGNSHPICQCVKERMMKLEDAYKVAKDILDDGAWFADTDSHVRWTDIKARLDE